MDEQHEREAFEALMTDGGKWPKAVERTPSGDYRLALTATAWRTWQAAWKAARSSEVADAARVIEWAMDPNRKRANLAFTAGPERQAAYWIEWAQQQWRPISSAPKDGTTIWVIDTGALSPRAGAAHFVDGEWRAGTPDDWATDEAPEEYWGTYPSPTHWMPLPKPPAQPVEAPQREGGAG